MQARASDKAEVSFDAITPGSKIALLPAFFCVSRSMGPSAFSSAHFESLEATRVLAPTASNITRLSQAFGEEIAHWSFLQWELRKKARAKFEKADEMLFDRAGLEMASHEKLAELQVSRFPEGVRIADLTCGIGSHLIAAAKNGPAIGYEIDPHRAAIAKHNLAVHGLDADVRVEDCLQAKWDFDHAVADPLRRVQGVLKSDPDAFSPNPNELIKRMWNVSLASVKLSPMLTDAYLESLGGERWFLSFERECREVHVLVGIEHRFSDGSESRGAWAAMPGTVTPLSSIADLPGAHSEPQRYFYEADPAAIRAHALGDLCSHLDAALLGDSNGYLTSAQNKLKPGVDDWVRRYEVLAYGHADQKRIRGDLKRLDARIDAVKVRGAREDPMDWQKRLRYDGSRRLVLALYPVGESLRYALLEPLR